MRVLAAVLLLAGCSGDRGACLKSERVTQIYPQYITTCVSGVCTMRLSHMLPLTTTVCRAWEYPDGRPTPQEATDGGR